MDRLFTFREDQKPNVSPNRRQMPPGYVVQPSYSPNDHVPWSQFYTRADLQAQDAMLGSASKVMRPPQPEYLAQAAPAPGGFGAIADQALENARAERPTNIQIGEPGQGIGMQQGTSNVGRGTQVGAPKNDWRTPADPRLTSRPGDYDFERSPGTLAGTNGQGEVLAETAPKFSLPVIVPTESGPTLTPDEVYLEYNAKNEATRYRVQTGDTLGSIAAQPKIYNDTSLWPLIYTANRKAVGRNPSRIKPRMELTIPRDYTEAQAKAARQRGKRR
jgi:nucleoid-associated protein YgaU